MRLLADGFDDLRALGRGVLAGVQLVDEGHRDEPDEREDGEDREYEATLGTASFDEKGVIRSDACHGLGTLIPSVPAVSTRVRFVSR